MKLSARGVHYNGYMCKATLAFFKYSVDRITIGRNLANHFFLKIKKEPAMPAPL